jgi:hypothetical protein
MLLIFFRLLAEAMAATVVLNLTAIRERLSPVFTVYVRWEVDDVPVAEPVVSVEEEALS